MIKKLGQTLSSQNVQTYAYCLDTVISTILGSNLAIFSKSFKVLVSVSSNESAVLLRRNTMFTSAFLQPRPQSCYIAGC